MSDKLLKPAVILVADRTLSADYKILFEGIFGTMQTTQVPEIAMRRFLCPPVKVDVSGRAKTVPLGLRRVESAVLKFTELRAKDVVCTTPEKLGELLGPWVKVVGFSSSDPMGMGMSNTTTTNFWKGELYTKYWTRQMLKELVKSKDRYNFKVVAGGAGAWQFVRYGDSVAKECIDVIFEGYFEGTGPGLFSDIVNERPVDDHVCETKCYADKVQPMMSASGLGIIELSRGCGRGCKFCTMAGRKMEHISPATILSDIETNVSAGVRSVVSGSEDFFRYGAKGLKPDFDKLCELLEKMRQVKGISFMQIDHANISSVMQLSQQELTKVRELLSWQSKTDYLWVNMGIESANGRLVAANCPGKISPFDPDDWEQLVRDAAERMSRAGFFSVFSVILGLPGETGADVLRTLELVKYLGGKRAVIFPIFFEPLSVDQPRFTVDNMTGDHLELYRRCYEINFKMVPRLFWDNQRAGGVGWLKRAALRALGMTEVAAWSKTFKKVGREIKERESSGQN